MHESHICTSIHSKTGKWTKNIWICVQLENIAIESCKSIAFCALLLTWHSFSFFNNMDALCDRSYKIYTSCIDSHMKITCVVRTSTSCSYLKVIFEHAGYTDIYSSHIRGEQLIVRDISGKLISNCSKIDAQEMHSFSCSTWPEKRLRRISILLMHVEILRLIIWTLFYKPISLSTPKRFNYVLI